MSMVFIIIPLLQDTSRQINLYRMFFADFSVNSQPIFMKFCMDYLLYGLIFIGKYCIAKQLDYLACNAIQG